MTRPNLAPVPHNTDDATAEAPEAVAAPKNRSTSLSPHRTAARADVARDVEVAAATCGGLAAVARSIGVTKQRMQALADPELAGEAGKAIALADVLCGPKDFARSVLTAAIRRLDGRGPDPVPNPSRAMRLGAALGELQAAWSDILGDGTPDPTPGEARELAKHYAAIQRMAAEGMRACGRVAKGDR